jgi:hypothetical protein
MSRFIILAIMLLTSFLLLTSEPFTVRDYPNDDGRRLILEFDDTFLREYSLVIYRSFDSGETWEIAFENPEVTRLIDVFEEYHRNPIHYKLVITYISYDLEERVEVIQEIFYEYHTVIIGETLWGIASREHTFGDPYRWREIFYANLGIIENPDLIFTDQVIIIPRDIPIERVVYHDEAITEPQFLTKEFISYATPIANWFDTNKTWLLVFMLIFCLAVIYYIVYASRGKEFYIRKINGLEAIDDAVGRATEMGRPVLFIPGISDISDMQTIAAVTILSRIAETCAEYHTKLVVPCRNAIVMSVARDIVKSAYLKVGVPDSYNQDNIFYLTDDQFGYVAGVDGIMVREKPAANFLLGAFWAESLIIAETGFSIGAIQVSGTANPAQIPFFVAACDYTLIGEELYAASAYLSKNPQQIGSLKGQDFGKIFVISLIVVGVILEIASISVIKSILSM